MPTDFAHSRRCRAALVGIKLRLRVSSAVTVISATHDFKMLNVSDRVVWIRDGRVDRIGEEKFYMIGSLETL